MIFGRCPYCDEAVFTPLADIKEFEIRRSLVASKEQCPSCKKRYWLKHSIAGPIAYPVEMIEVDEKIKEIRVKEDETG